MSRMNRYFQQPRRPLEAARHSLPPASGPKRRARRRAARPALCPGLPLPGLWLFCAATLVLALTAPAFGENVDPAQIVRDASWNEVHSTGPKQPYRFTLHKEDAKGSTTKEIVETHEGDVARLIAKNGRPLTSGEEQTELARLNNLMAHPEVQAHRHKREKEDGDRGDELVRMLPDAFLYTYEGMVEAPSGPCYRFSFKPNPNFVPPDREGEVFHGMVGELWVDQAQKRLVRIDAHLISDVNFGWGVLGKLYKGGSIMVENTDVGMHHGVHHWETVRMQLKLTGKILMMKSVDFSTTQTATAFAPVPREMGYRDAIRMLLAPHDAESVAEAQ